MNSCNSVFLIPKDYVKSKAPIPEDISTRPLVIDVDIWVWAVTEVSARNMDIKVDTYITFTWKDYRLNFTSRPTVTEDEWLPVGDVEHNIWLPYVTFRNCKGCTPVDLDTKKTDVLYNTRTFALRVLTRSMTNFACNIYLANYPMDTQRCSMQLENYYEDILELQFRHVFPEEYKRVASNQSLAEYQIAYISPGNCTAPIFDGREYACVEMNFVFVRQIGYYMCTLYAPTFLIVVLSWMSFWIPADTLQARITLGVTCLLTLATRLDQSQKNLPPVSYIKAIDIWLFVCMFMVFSSLIELAFTVAYVKASRDQVIPIRVAPATSQDKDTRKKATAQIEAKSSTLPQSVPLPDRIARVLFPTVFAFFNIIYWIKYTSN